MSDEITGPVRQLVINLPDGKFQMQEAGVVRFVPRLSCELERDLDACIEALKENYHALIEVNHQAYVNYQEPQGQRLGRETLEYWRGHQHACEDLMKCTKQILDELQMGLDKLPEHIKERLR